MTRGDRLLMRFAVAAHGMDCEFPTDGDRLRNREAYEEAFEYAVKKMVAIVEQWIRLIS